MTDTVIEPAPGFESEHPVHAAGRVLRAVLRAPFEARTWKEFAFLLAAAVLGCLVIAYLYGGYGAGLLSSLTLLGIPLLAGVLLGGRLWGRIYRAVGAILLDESLPAPPAFAPRPGFIGWLRDAFTDRVAWRALLFLLAEVVLGLMVGYVVLIVVAVAVFTAISPIPWVLAHPTNVDSHGRVHHSMAQFGDYYIDTWPRVLTMAAIGVLGCLLLPWLMRGTCRLHLMLMRALLTPTAGDRRLAELQESRRVAVADSAATLRRLERDLHDGTQARLVAIAMALGRAEDRLAAGADATDLIADARTGSKEALTELRELVRGIHPPALELGLEPALETLAARCAVPVRLRVRLPRRPDPAVEAIAYFSVAELLTNVVKHSGADRAEVSVRSGGGVLVIAVHDNGHGGLRQPAVPNADTVIGGGLAGLAARARAVDGTLTVDGPSGGPTVVTLSLPLAGPR